MLRDLSSLRLTEALLFWIAFLCIVATIIPQTPYLPTDGIPLTHRLMMLLSLRDVFHSLWFLVPVVILALNMLACMWVRMRWRRGRRGLSMPGSGLIEVALPVGSDPQLVREGLRRLVSAGYALVSLGGDASPVVVGEKGSLRRFAPLLVHASIFFILIGAALAFTGFKGTMEIPEGGTVDVVTLYDGTHRRLPFALHCNAFDIKYYENGMPREYRSDISFVHDGIIVREGSMLVNHPVRFQGILFSQSGYDQVLGASLTVESPSGTQSVSAGEDTVIEMQDASYRIHVMRVVEDMMRMGPGVQLLIEGPDNKQMLWLFRDIEKISKHYPGITTRVPQFNPSLIEPYTFILNGVTRKESTILGVNRDPGVPFAAAGSILFVVGIAMIFLMTHEKVWASAEEGENGLTVRIGMKRNNRTVQVDEHMIEQVKDLGRGPS